MIYIHENAVKSTSAGATATIIAGNVNEQAFKNGAASVAMPGLTGLKDSQRSPPVVLSFQTPTTNVFESSIWLTGATR